VTTKQAPNKASPINGTARNAVHAPEPTSAPAVDVSAQVLTRQISVLWLRKDSCKSLTVGEASRFQLSQRPVHTPFQSIGAGTVAKFCPAHRNMKTCGCDQEVEASWYHIKIGADAEFADPRLQTVHLHAYRHISI
jgi:hypothetical protein